MSELHVESHVLPTGHPLAPHVIAIFRFRARPTFVAETILPKGNVDILFNGGEPLHLTGSRMGVEYFESPGMRVAGVHTRPIVSQPHGHIDLLGISLRAEACTALLPVPIHEITDRFIEASVIFPELADLSDRLWAMTCFEEQRDLLLTWLFGRFRPAPAVDLVRHACMLLRKLPAEDAVRRAACAAAVSPRHLRRLFAHHVGLSPAEYIKLGRFVDALHLLNSPTPRLTTVAHAAGYYDQAHFCRDFRQFGGMTPIEYRSLTAGPAVGHVLVARSVRG